MEKYKNHICKECKGYFTEVENLCSLAEQELVNENTLACKYFVLNSKKYTEPFCYNINIF